MKSNKNKKFYTISLVVITIIACALFAIVPKQLDRAFGYEPKINPIGSSSLVLIMTQKTTETPPIAKLQVVKPKPKPAVKYIEINISRQRLYAHEGRRIVKTFLISSGTYRHPTPLGNFRIYSRSRASLMTGPGYYLPNVQWVSRFSGGCSIHGTYWHHNFGHRMSHGCVNATNADANFIYRWAPMGTKVIVHN